MNNGDNEIRFWVPGVPQPGGSKRPFFNKHTGRAQVVEANPRAKDWRASVAQAAEGKVTELLVCPLRVRFDFVFVRPKGHYRTGKNAGMLKDGAPPFPAGRPDALKVGRSTEDALKGIIYRDDSQIVTELLTKRYGPQAGCLVTIRPEGT